MVDDKVVTECSAPWANLSSTATMLLFKFAEKQSVAAEIPSPIHAVAITTAPVASEPAVGSSATSLNLKDSVPSKIEATLPPTSSPTLSQPAPLVVPVQLPTTVAPPSSPAQNTPLHEPTPTSSSLSSSMNMTSSLIWGSDSITVSALFISGELEKITSEEVRLWLKSRFKLEGNISTASSGNGFFVELPIPGQIKVRAFNNPPKLKNIPVREIRVCLPHNRM